MGFQNTEACIYMQHCGQAFGRDLKPICQCFKIRETHLPVGYFHKK